MLAEDFIVALTTKYKDKKDIERNKVFYTELTRFIDKCPEGKLQEVYDFIPTFHKWSTPFDVWKIIEYASEQGYIEKPKKHKDYLLFYRCNGFNSIRVEKLEEGREIKHYDHIKCNTEYSFRSTGCPNCHSTNAELIHWQAETLPENVLIVKEDCHKCINYDLSHTVNLQNDVHGAVCGNYGKKPYPTAACKECKCKKCCDAFKQYTESPRRYTDSIKELGVDPMSWIGKHLVVSMHIRDEKRLSAPERKGLEHAKPSFFGVNIEELAKSKRVNWSNHKNQQ